MDALNKVSPQRAASGVAGTQAVARAAALLRAIAGSPRREAGLADLARALELERPTAHRILRRLVGEGLVQQNPATRSYVLGPLVFELGLVARPPLELYGLSSDALAAVAEGSGDTAFAIIGSGLDGVCLDRREGSYPVKALMLEVGRRRPMGSGAGSLAMLAAMAPDVAERILDANAARLRAAGEPDAGALKSAVALAREHGYAVNAPGEAPEIMSIGIAVQNVYGTPIMGLSICALRFRIEHRIGMLADLLRASKAEIEARLQAESPATA
ncbi:IclR family transcriptional regulator [Ramlibacter terrae]|uniref:IclR family transcriptional regulator n=1 Tax=Ramlibacter terrae TaxID=2732511 RepID=A0ABX6P1B1_9BURK|nr:IclR family transcriptional regulator [Ramlibacter terrae]